MASGCRSACSSNSRWRKPFDSDDLSDDDSGLRYCNCGLAVVVRTSWTTANPERRFRGCPGTNGSYCRTFGWVDPPMCLCSKEVIPGLLKRLSCKDATIKDLQDKLRLAEYRRRRFWKLFLMVTISGAILLLAKMAFLG